MTVLTNNNDSFPSVIIHVPHASRYIPKVVRETIILGDVELEDELDRLTDHYTDELFSTNMLGVEVLRYPVSRYVADPERFADDDLEPMARRGQGVVYTKTVDGRDLRKNLTMDQRRQLLDQYYWPHHSMLEDLTRRALSACGHVLIIDGHSFPNYPLPVDLDQSMSRPDICIGTDDIHTPAGLVDVVKDQFEGAGLSVGINRPYGGTMVPTLHYRKNCRVMSVMIEINRHVYLQGEPANIQKKDAEFAQLKSLLREIISDAKSYCASRP